MNILNIDKKSFLRGLSTSKYTDDGGYSPESTAIETTRRGDNFGLLSMGRTLTNLSTNIADIVWATTIYSTDYYSIGDGGRIYKTSLLDGSHTVLGTESVKDYSANSDIAVYNGELLIPSENNITKSNLLGTVIDNDWWTTVAGGSTLNSAPHKIIEFQSYLFIANGNLISSWNGTTAVNSALNIGTGWVISDISIHNNYLYISANFNASNIEYNCQSKIFVWDGYSNSWNREIVLHTGKITAIESLDGLLYFSAGYGFYLCDGYTYKLIRANIANCNFHTLIGYQNVIYFKGFGSLSTDQVIYSYNTITKSFNSVIYELGTTIDSINTIAVGLNDNLDIFAYKSSTNYFFRASLNTKTGTFYSNWFEPTESVRISKVEILFNAVLGTSDSYTFTIKDEAGTTVYTKDITYTDDGNIIKWWKLVGNLQVNAFRVLLSFNHANCNPVRWIKVYYDRTDTPKSR